MKLEIPADLSVRMRGHQTALRHRGRRFTLSEFQEFLRTQVAAGEMRPETAERHFAAWIHTIAVWLIDRQDYFPLVFQDGIDHARLPNPDAFAQVMKWSYFGGQNLVAFGDTGTGKTRAIYALLLRIRNSTVRTWLWKQLKDFDDCDQEWVDYGVEWSGIIDIPATSLAALVRKFTLRDPARLSIFMEFLKDAGILFIDDISQLRLTDRLAECLFDVVDCRYRRKKSLIVTSQVGADGLVDKLAHGDKSLRITARAIVRRISQDGEALAVDFDAPTPPPAA